MTGVFSEKQEMHDATRAQIRAAEPNASTWVAANAGSGKTRVLTDRVARLLLRGIKPEKILCLTYTRAAAAEMQNRLFERLGKWAMMPDQELNASLLTLGEDTSLRQNELRAARRLFANALETPGGLKIQTIHSFCDKLLRRFPLEAGVSPQFEVLDERQAKLMRAEILDELALGDGVTTLDRLARFMSALEPDALLDEISHKRKALDIEAVRVLLGSSGTENPADFLDHILGPNGRTVLAQASRIIKEEQSNTKDAEKIDRLLDARSIGEFLPLAVGLLLFGSTASAPFSARIDKLPSQKPTRAAHPEMVEDLNAIMERTGEVYWLYADHLALERAEVLSTFADVFLQKYDLRKTLAGLLDYNDLIARAGLLLSQSKSAQWVLYKLDGGIDHVLVDEAQDTSADQWNVINFLTDEFTSGNSANADPRTVFVVGDEKQSIYSFQGADPAQFDVARRRFSERLGDVDQKLEEVDLSFSFRSADPVLQLVDKVFDDPQSTGFLSAALHKPFKTDMPGRVDLWPFEQKQDAGDEMPWFKPVDMQSPDNPHGILARKIADWIKSLLDSGRELPGQNRAIQPSDFLVLVQGRRPFFHNLIKELKERELPIAGADRLNVGQELAVRDVLSLLKFTDLPQDNLSLAEAMRSPLLDFSEDQLYRVAHGREKHATLWQALLGLGEVYPQQLGVLRDILSHADFLPPFELIERILTQHQGRENLLARLGVEAEDGIDELLSQAMQYERLGPPSLSGFLNWFAAGKVEIKREMDSGAGQIRVMTVHGAKGLESPIVILPDTAMRGGNPGQSQILELKPRGFLWKSSKDMQPSAQIDAQQEKKDFDEKEAMRLLYVALTRAEQWLVVAGAGSSGKEINSSWYNLVANAMKQGDWLPVESTEVAGIGACSSVMYNWSENSGKRGDAPSSTQTQLPDWASTKAPAAEKLPRVISPSDLPGEKIVTGVGDNNEGTGAIEVDAGAQKRALRKGLQVHILLEHLPKAPVAQRLVRAKHLLVAECEPVEDGELEAVLAEASGVLDDPSLAHLFGPESLAEVEISAPLPELGMASLKGIIDRLVVEDTRVLIVDFKTNALVPQCAEDVPIGILRQLGAYLSAVRQIYPERTIEVAVLWTANRCLMPVPQEIVIEALKSSRAIG